MVWFKVDDGFYTSRKVLSIPRRQRLAAVGLWTMAGNWSGRELTDGVVPSYVLDELGATNSLIQALVDARLWLDQRSAEVRSSLGRASAGIEFSKWAEYQPTRAKVESDREKERIRKESYRLSRRDTRGTQPSVPPESPPESQGASEVPDPTRPDPTSFSNEKEELSSEVATAAPRPDVELLLDLLDAEILSNGGKAPARNGRNRDAMRLLLDRDGRTADQVERAIRWCQADEFWRANILSASKLREKYDQLRLGAQRQHRPASKAQERQQHNLGVVERLAALDAAEQRGIGS